MFRIFYKITLTLYLVSPIANATNIDLWQTVQIGQQHDESVRIVQKSVEEMRLQKRISFAPLLPQISLQASAEHTANSPLVGSSDGNSESIRLTQTVWDTQKNSLYAASKKNLELVNLESLKAISTNIVNVTESYLSVLSAKSNLELARGNVASVEAHKKVVEALFSIHESTTLDLTEAVADLDLARVSVLIAENALANSLQQLIVFIGDNNYELIPVVPELDITKEMPDRLLSEWLEIAERRNYDLQISRIRGDLAKINIKQAKLDFSPSVNISASYRRSTRTAIDGIRQATLSVDIPLYKGGMLRAKLQQMQVAYDRQLLHISQEIKQLRQKVTSLYQNRQSLRKRIFALRSLVVSVRIKLTTTQDGFNRGDRTSQEVLDAQNVLVQAEIDLIGTIHDYILSGLQSRQLVGILSLQDIQAVNRFYFTPS